MLTIRNVSMVRYSNCTIDVDNQVQQSITTIKYENIIRNNIIIVYYYINYKYYYNIINILFNKYYLYYNIYIIHIGESALISTCTYYRHPRDLLKYNSNQKIINI